MSVFSIVLAVFIGCALAYRFGALAGSGPRWAQLLLILGVGIGLGVGVTGTLFFLSRAFTPIPYAVPVVEGALGIWLVWELFRLRAKPVVTPAKMNWTLLLGTLAALAFAFSAFAVAWEQNPQGSWDAFSIWNLRAKIVASPDALSSRAWSPLLRHTHPGYPMLLSAFIGRAWAYGGSFPAAAPILTGVLFFLGMLCVGIGGLAVARSTSLGLAFGLVLAASPSLLHEVPAQYADVPLAYFFVATVAMALLDRSLLAGVFAGLATFTKNEGAAFLLVAAVALLLIRKRILLFLAGAAPFAVVTAIFKFVIAPGVEPSHVGNANTSQIGTILASFASEFLNLGADWYHPLLPVAALALFWGIDKRFQQRAATAIGIALAMLAIYFGVILFTRDDVSWQVGTALSRLYVQVWPTALFGCVYLLRSPDEKTAR